MVGISVVGSLLGLNEGFVLGSEVGSVVGYTVVGETVVGETVVGSKVGKVGTNVGFPVGLAVGSVIREQTIFKHKDTFILKTKS